MRRGVSPEQVQAFTSTPVIYQARKRPVETKRASDVQVDPGTLPARPTSLPRRPL